MSEGEGDEPRDDGPAVSSRGPELGVAAFLMALAVLVIVDSVRVGTGWGDDGPRSGYFPFYIGLLLLGASASVFVSQLWRWKRETAAFAGRGQLRLVWAMLWPIAVYVALIGFTGIYVASAVLVGWFMWRHGKYRWRLTLPVAIGVPIFFFVVFERWFLVPLPKGPIERLLGF